MASLLYAVCWQYRSHLLVVDALVSANFHLNQLQLGLEHWLVECRLTTYLSHRG